MPRLTNAQVEAQLQAITALIAGSAEAMSRRSIQQAYFRRFNDSITSRTLQRRLEQLVIRGDITSRGEGPAIAYRQATTDGITETSGGSVLARLKGRG